MYDEKTNQRALSVRKERTSSIIQKHTKKKESNTIVRSQSAVGFHYNPFQMSTDINQGGVFEMPEDQQDLFKFPMYDQTKINESGTSPKRADLFGSMASVTSNFSNVYCLKSEYDMVF